jgi:8-oxo-dGTP pyrophosphatase MutT (NUDIX family)
MTSAATTTTTSPTAIHVKRPAGRPLLAGGLGGAERCFDVEVLATMLLSDVRLSNLVDVARVKQRGGELGKLTTVAETLIPRPAATVLTLRDATNGYEILMLRRNIRSDFVGGAHVFPGGAVDDTDTNAEHLVYGVSDEAASRRLDLDRGGLAFYVACLRELFEEAGLLIACDDAGRAVNLTDPHDVARMAAHRRAVNAGELDFLSMIEGEGLRLDLRGLEYVAHWITPVGPPRRYDTRFFVALAPNGQFATHDAGETVADLWVRPHEALGAHARGEFEMMFPTVRNLQAIAHFSSSDEVLDYARSLRSIVPVRPQIVERDGAMVIVTPGDEGYSVAGP